jgi:hypothetical protein
MWISPDGVHHLGRSDLVKTKPSWWDLPCHIAATCTPLHEKMWLKATGAAPNQHAYGPEIRRYECPAGLRLLSAAQTWCYRRAVMKTFRLSSFVRNAA